MPAGDGTGPLGLGGMTGRAAGFCAGFSMPGYMNPIPRRGRGMGRGWGRGRGRGRGWGYGYYPLAAPDVAPIYGEVPFYPAPSRKHELQALRTQAEHLEGTLNEIKKRITELQTTQEEEG